MSIERKLRSATKGPVTDPFFANVDLLLVTNPTSLANVPTNRRFIDTVSGQFLTTGTSDVSGYSGASPITNGIGSFYTRGNTGGALRIPTNANYDFAGDFTAEAFARVDINTIPNGFGAVFCTTNNASIMWSNQGNGFWCARSYGSPTFNINSNIFSRDGVWRHLAISRSGNTLRFFVDGVLQGSQTVIGTLNFSGSNIGCGLGTSGPGAGDNQFLGYINSVRYSNIARYTTNFTKPTSLLTADANTVFLFSGSLSTIGLAYYDISNRRLPILQSNQTIIQQSSATTKYSQTAINSTSGINTNQGVLISSSPNNIATAGNFTVECWVNIPNVTLNTDSVIYTASMGSLSVNLYASLDGNNNFSAIVNGTGIKSNIPSRDGQWHHLAIVRNGTGSNNCTFYVDGIAVGTLSISNFSLNFTVSTFLGLSVATPTLGIGVIDQLRFTNGVARYTSNFTPPTSSFPTS